MRVHLCCGNYEDPHHHDVNLRDVVDIALKTRPNGVSIEAANPRHAHEWALFEEVRLPAGKVVIPGVLDTKYNYIEHPELVAQRLVNYARLVGMENVYHRYRLRFRHHARLPRRGRGQRVGEASCDGRWSASRDGADDGAPPVNAAALDELVRSAIGTSFWKGDRRVG